MPPTKAAKAPEISEVKVADVAKKIFDGKKAEVYLKTGLGKTFLVKVTRANGRPALIAVHL